MESANYQSIKCNFKSLIRDDLGDPMVIYDKINNAVCMMNRIVIHTLQFMKLYILYCDLHLNPLPKIEIKFVLEIMKTLCVRRETAGCPPKANTLVLREALINFYQNHYRQTISVNEEDMSLTHLQNSMKMSK